MILRFSNLYLGNHLDYFGIKLRSMDAQVLSRLFYAKIIQSTTATTSIVCCENCIMKCKYSPSLAEGARGWVKSKNPSL